MSLQSIPPDGDGHGEPMALAKEKLVKSDIVESIKQLTPVSGASVYDLASLEAIEILHVGTSALLISAYAKEKDQLVVLKAYLDGIRADKGENALKEFANELRVLSYLGLGRGEPTAQPCVRHFVTTYGYGVLCGQPALVLEPLKGSIRDVLDSRLELLNFNDHISLCEREDHLTSPFFFPLKPNMKLYYWLLWSQQMADALSRLHSKGIVHRNISPNHFMFPGSASPDAVMLVDFSFARFLPDTVNGGCGCFNKGHTVGSPPYVAPESYGNGLITEKIDVWAYGFILLELFGGFEMFSDYVNSTQATIHQLCCDRQPPNIPYSLCSGLLNELENWVHYEVSYTHRMNLRSLCRCRALHMLIETSIIRLAHNCLRLDPSSRPSAAEISSELRVLLDKTSKFSEECKIDL